MPHSDFLHDADFWGIRGVDVTGHLSISGGGYRTEVVPKVDLVLALGRAEPLPLDVDSVLGGTTLETDGGNDGGGAARETEVEFGGI